MKFSEKWLFEWIKCKIDSDILHNQIVDAGMEIEYIDKFEPIFHGVLVGKIVHCTVHPELHKLKIVKVDIGNKILLQIICGASNCRNGIKVAVATIGSILPNQSKIDIKYLQGKVSEGMLCSFFELGLFYSNQIIEFSKDVPIGTNVNTYLSLQDNVIKISITPNRSDCLSILGISRNIAAMNNVYLPSPKYKVISPVIEDTFNVEIIAKKECIHYLGRIIKNININAETPFWMKKKLFLSDLLSENTICNIINYVLIEIGQPLNILNSDSIRKSIIIRMADNQEEIILKDNMKIILNQKVLVLSDIHKILSVPGNINSDISDINKNTKNVLLSTFLINKISIDYIIKKFNSNKILEYYNYGVDPFMQKYAIEYATDLIMKICGGVPSSIIKQQVHSSLYVNNTIRLHHKNIQKIIGFFIESIIISNILYVLNYQLIFKQEYWDVIPPSSRFDILIEEDVINDILRIYGYNNILLTPLKESLKIKKQDISTDIFIEKSRIILVHKGYYEVINYGFINPKIHDILFPDTKKLLISNPISKDMSCMRSSLWPGLLKSVSYNQNRNQENIRFFESGLCFSLNNNYPLGIKQDFLLGGVISGNYFKDNWYSKARKVDFYDLKGDLEILLELICRSNEIEFKRSIIPGLHPEQSASIYFRKKIIGSIGAIDPRIEKALDINQSTFLFEISLHNCFNIHPLKIQEISKFPSSRRDIAILISDNILVSDVINKCKKFFFNRKVEINLFDVYSCKEFSDKKISLGIRLIFQDTEKTLTEEEINLMVDNCIGVLKKKFQAILRK